MIYFALAAEVDRVKIGFTDGEDVTPRLAALQTACPCELTLVAVLPGGKGVERDFHQRFAAQRVRGEWFRFSGHVRDFLAGTASLMVNGAVAPLSYGLLSFWEPGLLLVERRARDAAAEAVARAGDDGRICGTELWFEVPNLDEQFERTMGWYRQYRHPVADIDEVLKSREAHGVAFDYLLALMPPCRWCSCGGSNE